MTLTEILLQIAGIFLLFRLLLISLFWAVAVVASHLIYQGRSADHAAKPGLVYSGSFILPSIKFFGFGTVVRIIM